MQLVLGLFQMIEAARFLEEAIIVLLHDLPNADGVFGVVPFNNRKKPWVWIFFAGVGATASFSGFFQR